jgi:hypothetical protein
MRNVGKRVAVGLAAVGVAVTGTGWYLAAHPRGHTHFESCRMVGDDVIALRYVYGVGDSVTTSVEATSDAVVVSLHIRRASGVNPAIALSGELRYTVDGGLRDRPVKDVDGTALACA